MPNVEAVTAKLEAADAAAAGAEPAPDANAVAPQHGDASGAGSVPADATGGTGGQSGAGPSPAGATTHDVLEAKLAADRNRRLTKGEKRAARLEREKQQQITAKLEADQKEAAASKEQWKNLGKGKSWLETLKEAGRDPRQVFEEMRTEALKAGTPEARIEAMEKAVLQFQESTEKALKEERDERQREREAAQRERQQAIFVDDFRQGIARPEFAPLLDEYEPPQLLRFCEQLRQTPDYLMQEAKKLGVRLTGDDGTFNMIDILSVMKASVDAVIARREQRRTQSAAPPSSTAAPTQAPAATKPTVNGTAARTAGNTIGNDLAASRASEAEQLKGMTREQRSKYLQRKYG